MPRRPRAFSPAEHQKETFRRLCRRPQGATWAEIMSTLEMSKSTALRIKVLLESEGHAFEETMSGRTKTLRMVPESDIIHLTLTVAEAQSICIAAQLARCFSGTGVKEDLDNAVDKIKSGARGKHGARLQNIDTFFYDVNEWPHDYSERSDDVDSVMEAGLLRERIRVTHQRPKGAARTFVLDPYTLFTFKKGFFIHGFSHLHQERRSFVLDDLRDVERLQADGFSLPEGYAPSQIHEGRFGLIGGPPVRVRLRFEEHVRRFVCRRKIHASVAYRTLVGDKFELTMDVPVTPELLTWIHGYSSACEAIEPPSLRERIASDVAKMHAMYSAPPVEVATAPESSEREDDG